LREADFPKPSNIGVSGNRTSFPKPQFFDIGEGIDKQTPQETTGILNVTK